MIKRKRKPTTPGEILSEEFLIPMGVTQKKLADQIGCDVKTINRIVNNNVAISTEIAVKLGAALKTSAEFWINAQTAVDIFAVEKRLKKLPEPLIVGG